jgi:hypothetical protein
VRSRPFGCLYCVIDRRLPGCLPASFWRAIETEELHGGSSSLHLFERTILSKAYSRRDALHGIGSTTVGGGTPARRRALARLAIGVLTLRARMHTKGGTELNACCYRPINQQLDRLTAPGGKRTVRVEGKSRRKRIVPVGSATSSGTLTLRLMSLGLAWSWNERG